MDGKLKYQRIMLKISGEALKGSRDHGYEAEAVNLIVDKIKNILVQKVEVAVVVGAGNIWRGVMGGNMGRVNADAMGMLGTIMNGICLKDYCLHAGIPAVIYSSVAIDGIVEKFNAEKAVNDLKQGKVVICSGGTGNPFFTTDTTAALRALELDCEAVIKATKVDGVYSSDPLKDPAAVRYPKISFSEVLGKKLKIMDSTAFSMCQDNNLAIIVCNFADDKGLRLVLQGDCSRATVIE
ncbi:MAG: UMP kinase [Lentisphaeria bacterium]|nr:UMP kinase [Lentisphaeria bacterium]